MHATYVRPAGVTTGPTQYGWQNPFANQQPATGTYSESETPGIFQQATDLLTTVAWVGGGALLLYLLWPAIKEARARHDDRAGGMYAPTHKEPPGLYDDEAETRPARRSSRRKVSVQFEE